MERPSPIGRRVRSRRTDRTPRRLDNAADPPLGIEFEEITAFVEKRRRSDLWQSGAAMLLFLPIGLLCVAAGIWLLMSPPEGQEATGFGWAAIVFGLFTLGFVMWWFLNKVRPVPLKGVSIESVTPAVRRGGQIDVQLLMEPGKEVRVSHLLLVYGTSSIEYRDSGLGPGEIAGRRRESTSWWDSPAYEAAQTATSERPVATFDVPGDIPPTYGGDIIICVHLIRVHKPGVKSTRLSTQRLERQVIVYA